ncbi:MAG TPA: hypothetical protein VFY73_25425 [Ideonella sp.]|nr:hypothetical protein [Ideonella sp.]
MVDDVASRVRGLSDIPQRYLSLVADFQRLFELAQRAGIVEKTGSLLELRRQLRARDGTFLSARGADADQSVNEKATVLLKFAVQSLELCASYPLVGAITNDEVEAHRAKAYAHAQSAHYLATGYLTALIHLHRQQSKSGASGRRRLGDVTRERVRQEAEQFRGKVSREMAAFMIAETIGKSASHVRKLLLSEYPGEQWDIAGSVVSPDMG